MKIKINSYLALILFIGIFGSKQLYSIDIENSSDELRNTTSSIISSAFKDSTAYNKLVELCTNFGSRLSGSTNLNKAAEWIFQEMKSAGFTNAKKEQVMVPHWVRNSESCYLTAPYFKTLPVLGLGGSVATSKNGIKAKVIAIKNFDELQQKAAEIKGKIVLYNFDFTGYGSGVQYRVHGASKAAQYGAVASIIRSVSPIGMALPHTGMMVYDLKQPKIPTAAISAEDAELIYKLYKKGLAPEMELTMNAQTLPDTISYNVMGEIEGYENPNEIIAAGGHLDSWDVGTGAQDDGAPAIAVWQAVKLLKDLGLKTKRTIRSVFWVNEENGDKGGETYAENHSKEPHSLMFEFDSGLFPPSEIRYTGPDSIFNKLKEYELLFREIDNIHFGNGGIETDIAPMVKKSNVPAMALHVKDDGKYFWYHHSNADTADKVDPKDMNKCVATIALILYIYANL